MEIQQTRLMDILGAKNMQLAVPVYQRVYAWNEQQGKELWSDIMQAGLQESDHFLGSFYFIEHSNDKPSSFRQLDIIDGQQRIATFTILIAALAQHLRTTHTRLENTDAETLEQRYLRIEGHSNTYKLLLSRPDRPTLASLIDEDVLPEEPSSYIVENFKFFHSKMEEKGFNIAQLWHGIQGLFVLSIQLMKEDSPQFIFETLNARGMSLTMADLIRNSLLITVNRKEQTDLYVKYWKPIEEATAPDPDGAKLNAVLHGWLARHVRGVRMRTKEEVYDAFKTYLAHQSEYSLEELLQQLNKFCLSYSTYINKGKSGHSMRAHDDNQKKQNIPGTYYLKQRESKLRI